MKNMNLWDLAFALGISVVLLIYAVVELAKVIAR
jgi:hypothetical protein